MRGACIDIGSNTTRLLVADYDGGRLRSVHQARAYTRIGQDIAAGGAISAAKIAQVSDVVADQLDQARRLEADVVRCVATAAARRAVNSEELVYGIAGRCGGLQVDVLTEEREARLAFLGASRTMGRSTVEPLGLVDVGGGSTELVVGNPREGVTWWVSLPIGSGSLTVEFMRSDPPGRDELDRARTQVQGALGQVHPPRTKLTVAVGGSAGSLLQMTGGILDAAALRRALELVSARTASAVAGETGLDVERVKLLAAGLVILEEVARCFDQPLLVGAGGLREGVLLDAARP